MSAALVYRHAQVVCCCRLTLHTRCMLHHLGCSTQGLGSMGRSEVQTRLARLEPRAHPDCFLVLGICSLLLLLGSMVALASTPAACAVFEGQQMQCVAWQHALQATEDLTLYRTKGLPRASYMHGNCQLTRRVQAALPRQPPGAGHVACMQAVHCPDGFEATLNLRGILWQRCLASSFVKEGRLQR